MTIEQCYQQLHGDYTQVLRRIPSAALVERFAGKFLNDGSYSDLCGAMESGSTEEAFQAAHTLRGVSANLSFSQLSASAGRLTEALRGVSGEIPPEAHSAMEQVKRDYQMTAEAIRAFQQNRN